MDAIEKRARELLAAQVRDLEVGGVMNAFDDLFVPEGAAVKAIVAALTPPEGYVLVPVEPTIEMLGEIQLVEHFTGSALRARYAAMIAARPEVP